MAKFGRLAQFLRRRGIATEFEPPDYPPQRSLERIHDPAYLRDFLQGELTREQVRTIGLPWSPGLVRRTLRAVGGTIRTGELALDHGLACNTAGGTHHAHPDHGSGFCILNDLAVAARYLVEERDLNRVLILDCDVHQGDGTAVALAEEPRVQTVSLHTASNFPFTKQTSDRDLTVPAGAGDGAYLDSLRELLEELRPWDQYDLVFYDAGVDVHRKDRLGHLELSNQGLRRRDRLVLDTVREAGVPVAGVIGGGYSEDLNSLVDRHANLHRAAKAVENGSFRGQIRIGSKGTNS